MTIRLTILVKGLILIAVPLCFQLGFIGLVAKMRRDNSLAENWTIHTKEVIVQAQKCRLQLLTAHSAIQGMILSRDPSFGERLDRAVEETAPALLDLRNLVVDNPGQTQASRLLEQRSKDFLAYMMEGRQLVGDGKMDARTAARRRVHSQEILDGLDGEFDKFLGVEHQLDVERHGRLRTAWSTFDRLLVGGIVTSVLFSVALAILFTRSISSRILDLTENARRLGESKELTPPLGGTDEIARLDRVFHEMAETLVDSTRREREHASQLEIRAEELAVVNAQLNEKAQENEMFVYSVSHDLRSPLVNLQGFGKELSLIGGDLVKLVGRDEVPADIRRQALTMIQTEMGESIGFIQSAVTRLSSIIDALLRLSRAGRVEYRWQSVEVGPIVSRVVSALRGTMEERSATVEVGELPSAWGDPTAIEQVFANLIGNALNYLDRQRPGRIEVFAVDNELSDEIVVYAVKDNGLGIADSYKSKVFTAFQRLHGEVAKGEGVGLALVRRVVERHRGRVWFESEVGKGTTFYVSWPAFDPDRRDSEVSPGDEAVLATTGSNKGRDSSWQPSR